jgi:hypothetical protein
MEVRGQIYIHDSFTQEEGTAVPIEEEIRLGGFREEIILYPVGNKITFCHSV